MAAAAYDVQVADAAPADADVEEFPEWSRALLDYDARFKAPYEARVHRTRGRLRIHQAPVANRHHRRHTADTSDGGLATGATVWDAGIVLGRLLARRLDGRRPLVELGAGTGVCGLIACAEGGASAAVLTDLPAVVDLLAENVARNRAALGSARVCVRAYTWGDADDAVACRAAAGAGPRVVAAADVLYRPQLVAPLAAALEDLLRPEDEAFIAADMAHCPAAVEAFVANSEGVGLHVAPVPLAAMDADWRTPRVRVLHILRPSPAA